MSHHTTINTTAHPDTLYDAIVDGLENAGIDNYEINDGHTRREWTAALRWCAGRIDMERGQARGWEITQDASIWASLIEAGELTPWAETPADPPRIAVEPPAAPDPASGMAGPETAAEGLCRCGLAAEVEQLRARVAELQQADLLIAHLVTTAHQWHAAYEAETSPTALADSPAYRQARVALSDAVYRLINAGRLPEHQCGPLSATPPEPAAALGDLGVTCREVDPGSGPVEIVLSRTGDQCPSRDETTPAPPQQAVSERTLAEIIEARIRADERARIAAAWRHGVVLSGPAMHVRASNPTTTTGDDHG